ncbi:transcriptional regulator [Sulfodiicoccus acidiphilus]|uniref:Transcriptional regulator n=1 Tax=Sulfodiicoccus acidiphilus TaxID=1670455 RepID=A0A348B0G4_9CREN|nr:helix-turn-helix domain-containing protein [Sulfodiicoccus acidiphilus]BBD71666.1 transcriptional regulator [Sulfodiicoccus acidiphilus]GGT86744.1 transcriptional regulator [Sulfodiicoccus acidiphilus]
MSLENVIETIAKRIAGDVVWNENPGLAMRKWRVAFNASQSDVARMLNVSTSVIGDYEKGRRIPGTRFIKKFVQSLIDIDKERGLPLIKELAKGISVNPDYVIDAGDFYEPVSFDRLLKLTDGILINSFYPEVQVYGYLVTDSIRSISMHRGNEFYQLLGLSINRALIFTKVRSGRSPMIALRIAPIKPNVVILHRPIKFDPLAMVLADSDGIPVILSTLKSEEELVKNLRSLHSRSI